MHFFSEKNKDESMVGGMYRKGEVCKKLTLKGSEKHGADPIMMKGNEWNGYQL